jgi:hypothetical protein
MDIVRGDSLAKRWLASQADDQGKQGKHSTITLWLGRLHSRYIACRLIISLSYKATGWVGQALCQDQGAQH